MTQAIAAWLRSKADEVGTAVLIAIVLSALAGTAIGGYLFITG